MRVHGLQPYVGTRPYEIGDRDIFFGRKHEARHVAECWLDNRITLLHGEAGIGKTSLLQAGVVPELVDEPVRVLSIGRLACRSDFPLAAVPDQNLFTLALLSSWFPAESPTRIAGLPVLAALRRYPPRNRSGTPMPTLAAIDAAELLFREPEPNRRQRTRFLDELAAALNGLPELRLILAVKEDHLEEAADFAGRIGTGGPATYLLKPFDRDGAIEAVQGPPGSFGTEVAGPLVDEFCRVRSPWGVPDRVIPYVDPALLQLLCARLWTDFRPAAGISPRQLAVEVNRVLSEFCGQALVSVANDHGLPMSHLRSWFRETFSEQSSGGVAESLGQVNGLPLSVVRAVEDQRLIKARLRSGTRCYELQHPRLAEAIELLGDKSTPMRGPDPVVRLRAAERALTESLGDLARRHADAVVRACGNGELSLRAEAECLLGNIAYQRDDPELAVTHYRRAARLFEAIHNTPAVGQLLTAVGRLMLAERQVADALRELRAAVQRLPNDLTVQTALGQALWQSGQSQAALAILNGVLTRDGDTPEALRTRGEIMADLGHAESALRDLRRVDHAARPSTQAAWALAQAMRQPGERELEELDSAADAPDSGPVLLRVARVRQLTGHRADAVAYAERAVAAEHPPLPLQLQAEAHRLISGS